VIGWFKGCEEPHACTSDRVFRIVVSMTEKGIALSLENRVAVITGGSRGIGAAIVRMFTRAGGRVIFSYQKAGKEAEDLSWECGGAKHCVAVQAELSSSEAAKPLIEAAVKHFGKVDILIGNHGVWPPQDVSIDQLSDEQWRSTLAINLDSLFGLVKHGVAEMKRLGSGGHVVLVSSTAGQRGEAFHCDYAASKGAIISMVKGLATELARDGIYVNCVAPGWVETEMAAPALNDAVISKRVYGTIPLGRAGKPEEIAAAVLFLCTVHAGFITGEILNVNGGAVLVG
jgi:3-oxoacyl-[acyl-carrier protein] reductase